MDNSLTGSQHYSAGSQSGRRQSQNASAGFRSSEVCSDSAATSEDEWLQGTLDELLRFDKEELPKIVEKLKQDEQRIVADLAAEEKRMRAEHGEG